MITNKRRKDLNIDLEEAMLKPSKPLHRRRKSPKKEVVRKMDVRRSVEQRELNDTDEEECKIQKRVVVSIP